jgi:mannose-6-phosphate isomerase-like protein (cupin superfamily)
VSGYAVAHLDEIDEITDGRVPWRPVRHHLGITSFGINTFTGRETGDRIINEHEEDENHEELYFVHSGRARFELDGESVDAPAGGFVFVQPGVKRTAFAGEPGTTLVAIGATAGQAYQAFGWELWAPLRGAYQEGKYDEVAPRLRELAEANPQYALLQFNLACLESLRGNKEEALDALRRAIEGWDDFRKYAKEDSDLDAIRDEAAFKELVEGATSTDS